MKMKYSSRRRREGSEAVRVGRGIGAKDADDDDSEVTEGDEYDCVSSGLVP